ncbi:hypothetical protein EJB05_41122 [Eragrostis curvula]|uniref:Uncharacterized protein n=1 Tax=Eragrostis curvula TaxID=38414 RepID=A0A5J9T8U6_9POAL|nr:hypothetical protein EJB05_41122 [Eragrostis curvula]
MPVNRLAAAAEEEVARCFGDYLLVNQLVAGAVSAPGGLGPLAVRRHHSSTESNTPYTEFTYVIDPFSIRPQRTVVAMFGEN